MRQFGNLPYPLIPIHKINAAVGKIPDASGYGITAVIRNSQGKFIVTRSGKNGFWQLYGASSTCRALISLGFGEEIIGGVGGT